MSLLLALLLQSAPPPAERRETVAIATPESSTQPKEIFECDLADVNRKYFKVVFERLGGRGYWRYSYPPLERNEVGKGHRWIERTSFFLSVIRDDTGALEAFSLQEKVKDFAEDRQTFTFRKPDGYALSFLKFGQAFLGNESKYGAAEITFSNRDGNGRFVGHCVVTPQSQSALTDEEADYYEGKNTDALENHELKALKSKKLAKAL
jgi:hypothetical protein